MSGVSVFPEGEEVLISRLCLAVIVLHDIGATDLKMGECADDFVHHNPGVVKNLLRLSGSGRTVGLTPAHTGSR